MYAFFFSLSFYPNVRSVFLCRTRPSTPPHVVQLCTRQLVEPLEETRLSPSDLLLLLDGACSFRWPLLFRPLLSSPWPPLLPGLPCFLDRQRRRRQAATPIAKQGGFPIIGCSFHNSELTNNYPGTGTLARPDCLPRLV